MHKTFQFPQQIYHQFLRKVQGIAFSAREIEVIAHILLGEDRKTIPHLMSLAEKITGQQIIYTYQISDSTVETHIENIYEKLLPFIELNKEDLKNISRKKDKIKVIIDKSDKKIAFEDYCQALKAETLFLDHLEKIFQKYSSLLNFNETITCQIHYWGNTNINLVPISYTYLARHFNDRQKKDGYKTFETTLEGGQWDHQGDKVTISFYILNPGLITSFPLKNNPFSEVFERLLQKAAENPHQIRFLLHNWKDRSTLPPKIQSLPYTHLDEPEDYFLSFFDILKNTFPQLSIEDEVQSFKTEYEKLYSKKNTPLFKKKSLRLGLSFLAFLVSLIGLLAYYGRETPKDPTLRSDLVVPIETIFLERQEILRKMAEKFKGKEDIPMIALVGTGGAGKTTLARRYGRQCQASIVWEINAETHSSLFSSLRDLAYALIETEKEKKSLDSIHNIQNQEEREKQLLAFVKQHLRDRPNWLLIYDNVENVEDVKPYLPHNQSSWGSGKVILTMRDANIKDSGLLPPENIIEIDELNQHEALTLFTKILYRGKDRSNPEIAHFLENIAPFPLDVSLAGYYIKNTDTTYQDYLELLNQHSSEFEKFQSGLLKKSSSYGQTRDRIITISLQKIIETHQKDFKDLLLFVSLLDSQNIPLDLLRSYKEKIVVDNFIHLLKEYSLVITPDSPGQGMVSLHRNIHSAMLTHLAKLFDLEKNKHLIEPMSLVFRAYIEKIIDGEDFHKMSRVLKHCQKFLSHTDLLSNSVLASLWGELGSLYSEQVLYEEAQQAFEKSLDLYKEVASPEPYWFARTLEGLGNVYSELGLNEKAKTSLEKSLSYYQKNNLHHTLIYARALASLGSVYRELGDYKKAQQLIEESLSLDKQNPSDLHACHARALGDLGAVYRELGNYTKAQQFLEHSLEDYQNKGYEDHPGYARSSAWLGCVYRDKGDYQKAKSCLEKSLAIYQKIALEDRPWAARTLAWLGCVERELGNFESARQVLLKSLAIYEKNDLQNHPWYARTLGWLSGAERELGNYDKAKTLIEKSLEIYRHNDLQNHPWFAWTLARLGNIDRILGQYAEAIKAFTEAKKIYQQNNYQNHTWLAWCLQKLGATYKEQGYLQEAQTLIENAHEIFKKNSYENHPWFFDNLKNLGSVYRELGDIEKAKKYTEQALTLYEKAYGQNHLCTASVLMELSRLQLLKENRPEARRLAEKALKILDQHPQNYAALELLADSQEKENKPSDPLKQEKTQYLQKALNAATLHFPPQSTHITKLQSKLNP